MQTVSASCDKIDFCLTRLSNVDCIASAKQFQKDHVLQREPQIVIPLCQQMSADSKINDIELAVLLQQPLAGQVVALDGIKQVRLNQRIHVIIYRVL